MGSSVEYRFVCPDCGECIVLDGAVRETLLERGCVVCGGAVSPADFEAA